LITALLPQGGKVDASNAAIKIRGIICIPGIDGIQLNKDNEMRKLFIISASLRRDVGPGNTEFTLSQGYRLMETEEEAVGSFVKHCQETRPGFAILQIATFEVQPEHVAIAAKEQAATPGEQHEAQMRD
jgi:hypothetical protein